MGFPLKMGFPIKMCCPLKMGLPLKMGFTVYGKKIRVGEADENIVQHFARVCWLTSQHSEYSYIS